MNMTAAETSLKELRKIYETSLNRIELSAGSERTTILREYGRRLELLSTQVQKSGDLDLLLEVKSEQTRFSKEKKIPVPKAFSSTPVIQKLQRSARAPLDSISLNRDRSVMQLSNRYIARLEQEKKQHTVDGKIPQAMEMRREIERVKSGDAFRAAQFGVADAASAGREAPDAVVATPVSRPQVPSTEGLYRVSWDRNQLGDEVAIQSEGRRLSTEMAAQGKSRIRGGTLECEGGRILVEDINEALLAACKQSNELMLDVTFETDNLKQTGPARIVSFSLDGAKRNFSLCQEGNSLLLRLRTTKTGPNGTAPQVQLCKLTAGRRTHVVVSYRPGELSLSVDGKEVKINQIGGDFSNWELYQLLLGNEWKDDRAWHGEIHSFVIANRAASK